MAQAVDNLIQFDTQVGLPMGLTDPVKLSKTVKKKYSLLNINIDDLLFTEQQVAQEIQRRQQNKPKEDWKEFVAIDKLFPFLAPSEKAQVLGKLEIQPDLGFHNANAQSEINGERIKKQIEVQAKGQIEQMKLVRRTQTPNEPKEKLIEHKFNKDADARKAATQGNGRAGV